MSKKILGWALVNALGTMLYITFVVGIMSNAEMIFGQMDHWVGTVAFLLLFVLSAAVTGGLVIGRPIWWYLEGNKKEAVKLFVGTVAWLAVFFSAIILSLMLWSKPAVDVLKAPAVNKPAVGLANPASVNCAQKGGRVVVQKDPNGGEYGLCYFEDNRACEEWALMRKECPVGGVKTTGFDTDAQKYCAWVGGQTFAVANAVCTFKDGSTCLDDDLFAGRCRPGDRPKR